MGDIDKKNILEKLELPREIVLNLPKVSIIGNNEIIIENHKGIMSFSEKIIKVNSTIGTIIITGDDFEILYMGGSTITAEGKIKTMEIEEK